MYKEELISTFANLGSKLKNVLVFTLDGNGKYYLQEKNKKYTTGNISLKEGISW